MPVVTSVSIATRDWGSCRITASSTVSEIWSAILSGCPSVTDSEVNRCFPLGMKPRLPVARRKASAARSSSTQSVEDNGLSLSLSTESYSALSEHALQGESQVAARGDPEIAPRAHDSPKREGPRHLQIDGAGPGRVAQEVTDL